MNKPIITISGSHSQGKSTLMHVLQNIQPYLVSEMMYCKLKSATYLSSLTRDLERGGISINEGGTAFTQMNVMWQHYLRLHTPRHCALFLDRCALDGYAYSMYFEDQMTKQQIDWIRTSFELMIPQYTKIFYIEPELPLVADGQRSIDPSFFNSVVANFEHLIDIYKLDVVRVSGNVLQRLTTVVTECEKIYVN